MDFGFMKSGRVSSEGRSLPEPFVKRLYTITATMIAKAAEVAAVYCEHAGRKAVMPQDVQLGLRYQARVFFHSDNLEQDVEEMEAHLDAISDEEDTDSEGTEDDTQGSEEWMRSECPCETCSGMHQAYDTWDEWHPTDEAEAFVKRAIDHIDA